MDVMDSTRQAADIGVEHVLLKQAPASLLLVCVCIHHQFAALMSRKGAAREKPHLSNAKVMHCRNGHQGHQGLHAGDERSRHDSACCVALGMARLLGPHFITLNPRTACFGVIQLYNMVKSWCRGFLWKHPYSLKYFF